MAFGQFLITEIFGDMDVDVDNPAADHADPLQDPGGLQLEFTQSLGLDQIQVLMKRGSGRQSGQASGNSDTGVLDGANLAQVFQAADDGEEDRQHGLRRRQPSGALLLAWPERPGKILSLDLEQEGDQQKQIPEVGFNPAGQ